MEAKAAAILHSRSETAMLKLILDAAMEDDAIRAVVLNGSRADSSTIKDCFCDYDIVYVVTDYRPYIDNMAWIKRFGEVMIMQLPNSMGNATPEKEGCMAYLMQFMDGTRIDLTIWDVDKFRDDGEPAVALLDKDGILPNFPTPDGSCYHVTPPAKKDFDDCCNEFWWLCPYAAKGLWRGNVAYVRNVMELYMRDMQYKMYGWYAASANEFKIGIGKSGKLLSRYLTKAEYELYLKTFPSAKEEEVWEALFVMLSEFERLSAVVADRMGFELGAEQLRSQNAVTAFLHHIRELDREATHIYP